MNYEEALDPEAIETMKESTGGDRGLMIEMIDIYLSDADALFAAMTQALAARDATELRQAARNLKSNSSNFGARALALLSEEMADYGLASSFDEAAAALPRLHAEFARVRAALAEERIHLGARPQ